MSLINTRKNYKVNLLIAYELVDLKFYLNQFIDQPENLEKFNDAEF